MIVDRGYNANLQGRQFAIQGALHKRFAGAKPCEFVRRSLDNLREVSTIVDTKALGDETAFEAWLRGISQKVARPPWEGSSWRVAS